MLGFLRKHTYRKRKESHIYGILSCVTNLYTMFNKIISLIRKSGIFAMSCLTAMPVTAQTNNNLEEPTLLIVPTHQDISSHERTLCYNVKTNVPFEVTENADWIKVRKEQDGQVFIHVTQNYYNVSRTANITFINTEKQLSRVLTLNQDADNSADDILGDTFIKPYRATDNNHQNESTSIQASIDGNVNTNYHSQWHGNPVNPDNPAILTYEFKEVDHLDFINYVPHQHNVNGRFGEVEVYVKHIGETDFTLYGKYDWKKSPNIRTIHFKDGLQQPSAIQFKVLTGNNNYAACAEMQFGVNAPKNTDLELFADDVLSELKEGVTEDDIDNMNTPFLKGLAYQMYNQQYDTDYRVAEYECILSYVTLSELWNAPGKFYDQLQGVTGINMRAKSKSVVVASGIPENQDVQLKVVAWYVGKIGNNFDGGNPHTSVFTLKNGINVIDYNYDYDGLAYICYYADKEPEKNPNIKVHFINGEVNGYLTPDKTNEQMHEICQNAKNRCMDVYGNKVHAVWESKGLHDYCKSTDGKIGYRQYMNILDSLIVWEHRSLGLEKYNRIPKNKTMAYVNYTYYMFQGGFGVSFHVGQQKRVLDCRRLTEKDDDAIWGLSHEWGHQHQMQPYFCWAGMSEVSNNVQSYYNVMKMGYQTSSKFKQWTRARNVAFLDEGYTNGDKISERRKAAYNDREKFRYSPKMYALCTEMEDARIAPAATNPMKAVGYYEDNASPTLCSLIMLYNYFTMNGFPDFAPDWYESLRQNDDENGSQVEKKGAVDKYELIASAQNNNKNNKLKELREKFPESCWVKDNYINEQHCGRWNNSVPYIMNFCRKASRIVGYNLMPYFEQWGYLRQVAQMIGDYGTKYYVMTKDMYDEFKADMNELVESGELKTMPADMVKNISYSPEWLQPKPTFEN